MLGLQHLGCTAIVGRVLNAATRQQLAVPRQVGNPVAFEQSGHAAGQTGHHLVLARHHGRHVGFHAGHLDTDLAKVLLGISELV